MLSADKQVLDAYLRNELQQLRRMELENMLVRFKSALAPATLIAGFSFEAIAAMSMLDPDEENTHIMFQQRWGERTFYIAASIGLALALFVVSIVTCGIVFGQRLMVQATAEQGFQHDMLIGELTSKFVQAAFGISGAMTCVVVSAISIIWLKQAGSDGELHIASITSSVAVGVVFLWTIFTVCQMFTRLHTWEPASSKLTLSAAARSKAAKAKGVSADEFYVAEQQRIR